jgi:hypothetical protein
MFGLVTRVTFRVLPNACTPNGIGGPHENWFACGFARNGVRCLYVLRSGRGRGTRRSIRKGRAVRRIVGRPNPLDSNPANRRGRGLSHTVIGR